VKKFRVLVKGQNFLLESDRGIKRFGFYTTRFVEAFDRHDAERAAIESLRQDDRLRGRVRNARSDAPLLFAEEIAEMPSFEGVDRSHGLAFYEDQPTTHQPRKTTK
jgi:hypothetical protein